MLTLISCRKKIIEAVLYMKRLEEDTKWLNSELEYTCYAISKPFRSGAPDETKIDMCSHKSSTYMSVDLNARIQTELISLDLNQVSAFRIYRSAL